MSFGNHNHAFVSRLTQRSQNPYNLRNRAPNQYAANTENNNRGRQNIPPPDSRENQRDNRPPQNDSPEKNNNENNERHAENVPRDANIQISPPGVSPVYPSTNINRPIPKNPRGN